MSIVQLFVVALALSISEIFILKNVWMVAICQAYSTKLLAQGQHAVASRKRMLIMWQQIFSRMFSIRK